eukprot:jgi/Ulvmu1/3098/UM015_0138.1
MYGPATDVNLISLPTSSPPPDAHSGTQQGPLHPQVPRAASPKPQAIFSHPYFTHAVSFDSALSSLPGADSGLRDAYSTASGPEATLYPDTINPAYQPGPNSSGAPVNRSPLSARPMNSSSDAPPELQSQTLDSAFAATADSSDVGPNRTLDQILASDANPSQSLLPLRQRRDDVRMVRAMVDDTVAATSRNIAPAPPPPGKAAALQPGAPSDDDDDGSGDWDIMGSDPEAAIAPRAGRQAQHSPAAAAASNGRRSADKTDARLNHVPVYDTGEPQYTFGDGGGPPVHNRFYAAVRDLAQPERPPAQDGEAADSGAGPAKSAAAQPAPFVASRSDSHTPRGTPSARANLSAPSHSSSNTSASHVHPSPPSSAVRPSAPSNGLSWRHTPMHAFDAPAPAIPQHGGRAQLQPPQSRASLPSKGRHGSFQMQGVGPTASVASVPSSVTDVSAFEGAADEAVAPQGRRGRSHTSLEQKRHSANDRLPYPTTGPQTPSGRLMHTPRAGGEELGRLGGPHSSGSTGMMRHSATGEHRSGNSGAPCAPARRNTTIDLWEQADVGKKVERWQEIPRQKFKVQKQIKRELAMLGSLKGDPLGQFQFHIPLFAALWGVVRESAVVPVIFTRGYKEVLGAAVSRGNLCRFCTYWHTNSAAELGMPGVRDAWHSKTMKYLLRCPKRFKAVMLWFRDATYFDFFRGPDAEPAPFTSDEAGELLAVSFMNNMLNRVTIAQLTHNETLPMMGILRPLFQRFPSLQTVMYKSVMRPGSRDDPKPGMSAEVRPHSRHTLHPSFNWALRFPHITAALAYLDWVVSYHLRGCFLPFDLCDAFLEWMERSYNGIYRGKDHYANWLYYSAKQAYPLDSARREAMLYMLLVACAPTNVPKNMRAQLRKRGWRDAQVSAMAPFAAFHAARITVLWQASVRRATVREADDDARWTIVVPVEELW